MRILLVNKFYYRRGGDCTAVLSTEQLLRAKGHEVAVFSTIHPQNETSPWEKYFAGEVRFASPSITEKLSAAARIFHSGEVSRKFNRLLSDFKPDVVHLHNIHSYISPLVAETAHRKGIRVVWTLHDYKLLCPVYTCLRNGEICEECFLKKSNVFRYRCMKDSRFASLLAWLEACCWNRKKLSGITDLFISPSHFLKSKMIEGGFSAGQIEVLHNFLPQELSMSTEKEDYYCYVGRLSEEKGVETLLEAAEQVPCPLKIIGGGPLLDAYRNKYMNKQIEFLGHLQPDELYSTVRKARFLVIPSIWYENNPYSVIEALCMGTPALGSRIGGIPELIEEGENGFLFEAGNVAELRDKIDDCFRFFTKTYDFGKVAGEAQNKFGSGTFYNKLIKIYDR
ncbi:MAG: glycosyltransferase family 4 protein [Tannerella sp.]|nr:glycosyltransferase family 4 protein [Tannerella sp.]